MAEQPRQTLFECVVTKTEHDRDVDNYSISRDRSWRETAVDIESLYEKLAEAKVCETPEEKRGYEYTTVSFGPIREIVIVSERNVDDAHLKLTPAWRQYEQKRQEEQTRKAQEEADRAARKEAEERAELARLLGKYPS